MNIIYDNREVDDAVRAGSAAQDRSLGHDFHYDNDMVRHAKRKLLSLSNY